MDFLADWELLSPQNILTFTVAGTLLRSPASRRPTINPYKDVLELPCLRDNAMAWPN